MSHNPETAITCPNCGHQATHNYCAQCGQATHLHKETFWGLIVHFIAHYFHYDSKFWQTIKILVTKPGQLTTAYWNKQRARYIPPISLYIFVSAIYFVVAFLMLPANIKKSASIVNKFDKSYNIDSAFTPRQVVIVDSVKHTTTITTKPGMPFKNKEEYFEKVETIFHHLPKVFFFLVPFYALIIQLLFVRRKEFYFVDHAVFSLHIHAVNFMVFLVQSLIIAVVNVGFVYLLFPIVLTVYIVMAMEKVYGITIVRAMFYVLISGFLYFLMLGVIMMICILYFTKEMLEMTT